MGTAYQHKKKHHPSCEAWWREHHDLGPLWRFGAWAACHHWGKINSQFYQGILQNNVTVSGYQFVWCNNKMILNIDVNLERMFFFFLKRPHTLSQLRSSREPFTPDILRIWLSWSSSVSKNGPKVLLNVVQVWSTGPGVLVWGYCQLLNYFFHQHNECLICVFSNDMNNSNCLHIITSNKLCLSIIVT